jgi:hypothetical protein
VFPWTDTLPTRASTAFEYEHVHEYEDVHEYEYEDE